MKASKITKIIEDNAPRNLAENWDNVGYQLGKKSAEIKKVLLTLDITDKVIDEAIENDIDLIISHHPFFFGSIKSIDLDSYKGKQIEKLIKNNITVYSAHTNLDKAENGINQLIAQKLGLKDIKPLSPDSVNNKYFKLVVYVPTDSVGLIRKVLEKFETGKVYDNYRNCTYFIEGTGTFEPINNANPTIGELNEIEEVKETRIETIINKNQINQILPELKKVHPYEEMAYDLFPITIIEKKPVEGLGRIGKLKPPLKPDEFIKLVKNKLNLEYLKAAGKKPEEIKKVAICTGAGSEFIQLAHNRGADVLITGDLKYHEGQRAYEAGIWILDAGHFGTEKQVVEVFSEFLEPFKNDIDIIIAKSSQDYLHLV